jgi:hypothetical protein
MIVDKRVFADKLDRIVKCYLDGTPIAFYSVFIGDVVRILDEQIINAAASSKALMAKIDLDNEEKMKEFSVKYSFLKSEKFYFDNKMDFQGEIDKSTYLSKFIKGLVEDNKMSLTQKQVRLKIEVEAIKRAMKDNFSKNYVHKMLDSKASSSNSIKNFLIAAN